MSYDLKNEAQRRIRREIEGNTALLVEGIDIDDRMMRHLQGVLAGLKTASEILNEVYRTQGE